MPHPPRIARRLAIALFAPVAVALAAPADVRAAWVWPLRGDVIANYRNGADPYAAGQHRGIDIAGAVGAPVVAATGGEVRFAGTAGSSGLTVSVRTADGRFDTSYLHLSSTAVREGESIEAGDRLGAVGISGARSTDRPHLHFGVRDAGSRHGYHDPLGLLGPVPAGPPGAPAPEPVPAPLPPAPAAGPQPVRVPARPRIPASRRVPVRPRAPERPRVPVGPRVPAAHPVPVGHRVPASHRVPAPTAPSSPGHLPAGAPTRHPAPVADPRTVPGEARAPAADRPLVDPRTSPAGPDIGWALACAGLLLAAAILGLSEDGRKATRRGREQVSGLLRPLLERR